MNLYVSTSNMNKKYKDLSQACKDRKLGHVQTKSAAVKMVLVNGYTRGQVAEVFEVTESTVYYWIARYEKNGIVGLEDQPRSGRPPKVSDETLKKLMKEQEPTFPLEMKNIVKEKTGVEYHGDSLRYRMRKFNWSPKVAQISYAHRATTKEIKKVQRARSKEISRLRKRGYTIFSMDQSTISRATLKGRVFWSERGISIFVPTTNSGKKIVIFGAIGENGEQYFELHERANNQSMMEFMDGFVKRYKKSGWILDQAPWHTSPKIIAHAKKIGLELLFLPTAVPELNAIEEYWHQLKRKIKVGIYYETFEDMEAAVLDYLANTQHNLDILKYFHREIVT